MSKRKYSTGAQGRGFIKDEGQTGGVCLLSVYLSSANEFSSAMLRGVEGDASGWRLVQTD